MTQTKLDIGAIAPLHEVEFSPWIRRLAILLFLMFIVFPAIAIFAPWQQNLPGTGQVAAFSPQERRMPVESPLKEARIKEVYVIENQLVEKGDPLMLLQDIDPLKVDRLKAQIVALELQESSYREQVETYGEQLKSFSDMRDRTIEALEAKLNAARKKLAEAAQKVRKAEVDREVEQAIIDRLRQLDRDNIAEFKLIEAQGKLDKAIAEAEAQKAALETAEADLVSAQAEVGKGTAEADGKIQETRTKLQGADAKVGEINGKLEGLRGELRAQEQQLVRAPRAGQVQRVLAFTDSIIVKQSQILLEIVPEVQRQAVELFVRGIDVPLIEVGRKVRLQFEGWPAIQWVAWPSVAVGTFGGVVAQVDAADSGGGRFRILITPDPEEPDWPGDRWLRQGVRAKGWVLLNEVPMWYEIWRQLNGFPPAVADTEPGAGKNGKQDGQKAK